MNEINTDNQLHEALFKQELRQIQSRSCRYRFDRVLWWANLWVTDDRFSALNLFVLNHCCCGIFGVVGPGSAAALWGWMWWRALLLPSRPPRKLQRWEKQKSRSASHTSLQQGSKQEINCTNWMHAHLYCYLLLVWPEYAYSLFTSSSLPVKRG